MKKSIVFILIAMLTAVLGGCIISTSPGTGKVIEMSPGETKVFKVSGVNLNTSISKCEWFIDRMDGTYSKFGGTDQIEFTVNPEGEKSNRVRITCDYYRYLFINSDEFPGWQWVKTNSRSWDIRILKNTAPVWQGDYYIEDNTDVQLLNGYTDITGSLNIHNSNIKSLSGLESITSVGKNLRIDSNNALTSLSGLENITSIQGDLDIWVNDTLTSLSGLESMTSVGGSLTIWWNKTLTSLSGLENITSVDGDLKIWGNNALTALGMTGLQKIGGDFWISNLLLCNQLAEELRDQVLAGEGIGGLITINGNKECTTP